MTTGPIEVELERLRSRLGWVPYFVLFIALAGAAVASWYVAETGRDRDRARFENEVQATIEQIDDHLDGYETLLHGAAGLFAAEPDVSAEEFGRYVDNLELAEVYPGVQGVGVSIRIPKEEVPEFEQRMQDVHPGFHVWPPVGDEHVHAIKFLEPLDERNRAAIGYNMYSEATRRAAMERARDLGRPAASGVVQLVQEIHEDVQAGFLIYVPLYESDEIPTGLNERREKLIGFVYSPFRADDLLGNIFGGAQPSVAFRLFDGPRPAPANLLHTSEQWREAVEDAGLKYERLVHMRVGGRIWTLEVLSLPGFGSAAPLVNARWIAGVGMLVSLILFFLTRGQTRARLTAEKAAADLRVSQKELRRTEARVRRLVESNIIGIVLGSGDGTVLEANDAFLTMLGSSRESLESGMKLQQISPEDSVEVLRYALTELERTGRFGPWEHVFVTEEGERCPALVGMALVEDARSTSTDWVAFVLDLSDRKHLETQLLEQKETLETLNRVQRVVSAELQVDNVLAAVSGAAVGLTGASEAAFFRHESTADVDFLFINPDRSDDSCGVITRHNPTVKRALSDIWAERVDRTDSQGDGILAVPVVSRFGSVLGALAVCDEGRSEFSERDHQIMSTLAAQAAIAIDNATLYEEARRDRNRAEQANRAKDQFLANLSHELRTPMTAIIGWARMLQLGNLEDDEYEEAVVAISRSARSQAQLIEDILDVSRITTGKMKIEQKPVSLLQVVDSAVDSVWPSIEEKSLQFRHDPPAEDLIVIGDQQRLQQVVWNLLSNAVKFTGRGGRIDLVLTHTESDAIIEVRDTGEGIDPAEIQYLFERFRQADGTTTRNFGGLGLGLSLVDYIVRAHGGIATVESEGKGRGACFRVELPLAGISEYVEREGDTASQPTASSLTGTTILVVEEDREIREMVRVLLRRSGAKVRSVRGALQARDHLLNEDFDVLLSEVAAPVEEGLELIRWLRKSPDRSRDIPSIAVTSHSGRELRQIILDAGYDEIVAKPLDPRDLIRIIEQLVAEREAAGETR